jgi:hypothetical protein
MDGSYHAFICTEGSAGLKCAGLLAHLRAKIGLEAGRLEGSSMYETANVYPILRPLGPNGTIEADREDEDARFALTPLGEAFLARCLVRSGAPSGANRRRLRDSNAPRPVPLPAPLH